MGYAIGTITDGSGRLAHQNLLLTIQSLAETNGWVTQRYVGTGDNHELILKGEGLGGDREIFVGFRTYQNISADYYNILVAGFTGYSAGATFDDQPGAMYSGVPAHNINIDYFMSINPQVITLGLKLGSPAVYEHAHVGYMLPYGTPQEFPVPLVCMGMLNGAAATRYSDTVHSMGYRGNRANGRLRSQVGTWLQPLAMPWAEPLIAGDGTAVAAGHGRPTGDLYWMEPVQLFDANNIYGVLDGVYQVTGFDNQSDRVIQIGGSYVVDDTGKTLAAVVEEILDDSGGRAFVTLQDVSRTGFNDHIALELR